MTASPSDADIAAAILALAAARGPGKSACPSEVARGFSADAETWRALTPRVRAVAAELAAAGRLRVTQKGADVDPTTAVGPVRLAAAK